MRSVEPVLIALGGNALILSGEKGYIEEQFRHTDACMKPVASLIAAGVPVVLTHGNGPIVGNILLRNECAKEHIPPMPLYICVADSQGGIGAMMTESLRNELSRLGSDAPVVTIVTHVVVDRNDQAFEKPSKPVGPYYSEADAPAHRSESGWQMQEIPGRGWRRLVPSPRPRRIVEIEAIRKALAQGIVTIASGGGGIPVVDEGGLLKGVDAVIDKDLSAGLLARELSISTFVIVTDVDGVYHDWNSPNRRLIEHLSVPEARKHLAAGQFPSGSMGPKIEAAVEFLESGGKEVIITNPELLEKAMEGKAGTRITVNAL